ncbi:MAG: family 43 glycosylhydrolase [Bacteroidota bacterium]
MVEKLLYIFLFFPVLATAQNSGGYKKRVIAQPLISNRYTSNPAVHEFGNKIYIYCSQDNDQGIPGSNKGDQYAMRDQYVYSMDDPNGSITEIGRVLDIKDIPWASRQVWSSDVAFHKGIYYLYFSTKDKNDVFRIGVATSSNPAGPFKAEKNPMAFGYSIDPCVFKDDDGSFYLYFGGIRNGQLQKWENNVYNPDGESRTGDQNAILPRVARLSADMKQLAEMVREVKITDAAGNLLEEKDNKKRFSEATWVHKYNGKYYLTYSTGDTRLIVYATGDSPYGPFTYRGVLLEAVTGSTAHHAIINIKGKWYLFYHDSQLSGIGYLRNIRLSELKYLPDGSMQTIQPAAVK